MTTGQNLITTQDVQAAVNNAAAQETLDVLETYLNSIGVYDTYGVIGYAGTALNAVDYTIQYQKTYDQTGNAVYSASVAGVQVATSSSLGSVVSSALVNAIGTLATVAAAPAGPIGGMVGVSFQALNYEHELSTIVRDGRAIFLNDINNGIDEDAALRHASWVAPLAYAQEGISDAFLGMYLAIGDFLPSFKSLNNVSVSNLNQEAYKVIGSKRKSA